jgi:hypothetical protein
MRDGSLDDVVAAWIDRIIEEHWGGHPGDNEAAVYYALLKHAAIGLVQTHDRFRPATDYREKLVVVLEAVRNGLPARGEVATALDVMAEPELAELLAAEVGAAQPPLGEHRDYWTGDTWKKDFYTSFSRWFWDMKDYAPAAGRRKYDFLWDVAEVWVATAASALVYYAKKDPERWSATAQMLRRYADLTEADGLRSLPWGRWGRYAKKNRRPKLDEDPALTEN